MGRDIPWEIYVSSMGLLSTGNKIYRRVKKRGRARYLKFLMGPGAA